MLAFLQRLLDEGSLSPHGLCLLWRPELIWLHVGSDALIALSYFSIPFALAVFVSRRPDVKYGWVFWSFAAFIMACGLTHVMSIWTLWVPDYALEGGIKVVTAASSIATATALWPLLPKILAIPTPAEFRRVGQALDETERELRLLVDGVTDHAIFMLDPAGRVTSWNAGAERIFGYRPQDIIGRHFSAFYTDDARRDGVPGQALELAAKDGRYENEALHLRRDGSRFWASLVVNAIHDADGRLIGFAKITRDVTDVREAQERLRVTREQLLHSQKMDAVGQLTGGVAHDFNNLLTVIIGNLETAQRTLEKWSEGAQERLRRSVRNALTGAQRAATLTQRLLAFARRQPLAPKRIEVNKLLPAVEELIRGSLGETVKIEVVGGGGIWAVEADPAQLEAAILNLALNARDAMPNGGKLTIETSNALLDEDYCKRNAEVVAGQYVRISVTDTGAGMTADVAARAFEPFFTTKPSGLGTGLGLSQVYGFIKQSGGHATIYSEPGHGTTVNLYLPRITAAAEDIETPPGVAPGTSGDDSELIFVVEDNELVRSYIVETLVELQYRVMEAPSAEAALRLIERDKPTIDLLLTDVILPGLNGRQLADALRASRPALKVLYVTGYSRNAIVHQGRLDPGVTMLQKPLTRAALSSGIRDLLDKP
jgi:PAS domain S-box-containing protein